MIIANSGSVGVGTSTPGADFDVNGTLGIFGPGLAGNTLERAVIYSNSTSGLLIEGPKNSTGNKLNMSFNWRGGGRSPLFVRGSSGSVGIGTDVPGLGNQIVDNQVLTVSSNQSVAVSRSDIEIQGRVTGTQENAIANLQFYNGPTRIASISTVSDGTPLGAYLELRTAQNGVLNEIMSLHPNGQINLGSDGTGATNYELVVGNSNGGLNGGNGRNLSVKAGDPEPFAAGKVGGNLSLNPGGPINQVASTWGNVVIANQGGNVAIGPGPDPSTRFEVNGNAKISGELVAASIKTNNWTIATPDYVFEKDYKLAPLDNVEKFVWKNKHLSDVPSAKEMKKNGIDLAEMNLRLLKKVEELTLYAIHQEKRNNNQEEELQRLKIELSSLSKLVKAR